MGCFFCGAEATEVTRAEKTLSPERSGFTVRGVGFHTGGCPKMVPPQTDGKNLWKTHVFCWQKSRSLVVGFTSGGLDFWG